LGIKYPLHDILFIGETGIIVEPIYSRWVLITFSSKLGSKSIMNTLKYNPLKSSTLCLICFLIAVTMGHMEMNWPYPLRSKFVPGRQAADIDYSMTSPLTADGSQFPCKGYISGSDDSANDDYPIQAGGDYNVSLSGTAFHNGGSCQLSLSYNNGATFRVIKSFIGGCPSGPNAVLDYTMPSFVPAGKAYLAWTWENDEGNREFYMNCAYITIVNPAGGDPSTMNSQPGIWVANQESVNDCTTQERQDPVYPDPGGEVEYGAGLSALSPKSESSCEVPPAADNRVAGVFAESAPSQSSNNPGSVSSGPPMPMSMVMDSSNTGSTVTETIPCDSTPGETTTYTTTAFTTTYICASCSPATFEVVTVTAPCDSSSMLTTSPNSIPSPVQPSLSMAPTNLPYANPSNFSPYLPCAPGSFLCTNVNTFWTCAETIFLTWTWQFPRSVAEGMACIPALSVLPQGMAQQPGSPSGYYRNDEYGQARPLGSCSPDGSIGCLRNGNGWMICDHGGWVDMGDVEAGTICENSGIIGA
jgi:hypothetical protein